MAIPYRLDGTSPIHLTEQIKGQTITNALVHNEQVLQITHANISDSIANISKEAPQQGTEIEANFDSYWTECQEATILDTSSTIMLTFLLPSSSQNRFDSIQVPRIRLLQPIPAASLRPTISRGPSRGRGTQYQGDHGVDRYRQRGREDASRRQRRRQSIRIPPIADVHVDGTSASANETGC